MPLPNQVSSWDSWDFTNTGHCILIHLHKSPGAYSHVFTKQTRELTEWNKIRWPRKENRTKIQQGCLLPNICGSYGPKKSTCLLLKEWEKQIHIYIYVYMYIYMPRLPLLLPPLSRPRLLQLPSHEGFIVGAEPHAGCAKKVSKLSFTTTSANICNPCFSTYPGATSHDMWCNTIISSWVCIPYAYTIFLLGNSQGTSHLQQLAPRLVLQLLQRLQKRAPGNGANCSNVQLVELVAIPPTHTTVW